MNRNRWMRVATALATLGLPILAGCGANPGAIQQPIPPGGGGYIPGGYIPGQPVGNGQCIPISQPIGFQGQNIYADYANIVGGRLPYTGQNIGTIFPIAGGTPAGQYNTMPQRSDGAMTLTLMQGNYGGTVPVPYGSYPTNYTAPMPSGMTTMPWQPTQPGMVPGAWNPMVSTITGAIQISPMVQQDIMMRVQMGQIPIGYNMQPGMTQYPYGQPNYGGSYYGQNICVSNIAMNIGKWDSQRLIYGGQVYLYLNGTMHGYVLHF